MGIYQQQSFTKKFRWKLGMKWVSNDKPVSSVQRFGTRTSDMVYCFGWSLVLIDMNMNIDSFRTFTFYLFARDSTQNDAQASCDSSRLVFTHVYFETILVLVVSYLHSGFMSLYSKYFHIFIHTCLILVLFSLFTYKVYVSKSQSRFVDIRWFPQSRGSY